MRLEEIEDRWRSGAVFESEPLELIMHASEDIAWLVSEVGRLRQLLWDEGYPKGGSWQDDEVPGPPIPRSE